MTATKKRSGTELARQRDLASHERVIENARQSFIDMGRALGKIRIEKLYEVDGYADFDEYVIERWEMRPQHAYRLITAARVALILSPMGYKITSERAARELAPIAEDPEMLRAVYEEAERRACGGRVTAALIAAAREALAPTVIDGDWRDDDEPELTEVVDAMREAIEGVERKQASPGTAVPEDGEEGAADNSGSAVPSDPPIEDHTDDESGHADRADSSALPEAPEGEPSGSAPAEHVETPPGPEDSVPAEEPERREEGVPPAAPATPKSFEFPDVEKLRQRTDLDQGAVEEYARKTAAHELAKWRDDLTTAFVNFRRVFRSVSAQDFLEKADDELINLFVNTHADLEEKWRAVAELKVAAAKANVVQLRSVK